MIVDTDSPHLWPMQRRSSEERPRLPHAPLLFAHPLRVPGGAVAGAAVLEEMEADRAVWGFMALRAAHDWAAGTETTGPLQGGGGCHGREEELLERACAEADDGLADEPPLLAALAALVAVLCSPEEATREGMARACLCVTEWALGRGAAETALAFAQAAALSRPESAGLAWAAGKMLRNHGRMREADWWLRRAVRVAVWTRDWRVMALSLNSRGNLAYALGRFSRARRDHLKALRIARRHGLRECQACVFHDLFNVNAAVGDPRKAEWYAGLAIRSYGPAHGHLPELAYDIAHFSIDQAHFARALPVLRALLQHFDQQPKRFQLLAAAARAAAACGEGELFERLWSEAYAVAPELEARIEAAPALVDLGLGAASLASWDRASDALEWAGRLAEGWAATDVSARVRWALDHVRTQRSPDLTVRVASGRAEDAPVGVLADVLNVLRLGKASDRDRGAQGQEESG
jgi:hypothetical protein